VLPLHVFEARYLEMVRDAMKGEGLIAISLLKPGWEANYEGNPAFHDIGTVGRIEDLELLEDGRYNLRLIGMQRVRFESCVRELPYRLARITPLSETLVDDDSDRINSAKLDLLASHGCLVRELALSGEPGIVLDDRIPFETAVNGACANLPVDPAIRQGLLEENDLLERQQRALTLLDDVLKRVLHLKALRSKDEGGSDVN
jgi:Lon protease-like protein